MNETLRLRMCAVPAIYRAARRLIMGWRRWRYVLRRDGGLTLKLMSERTPVMAAEISDSLATGMETATEPEFDAAKFASSEHPWCNRLARGIWSAAWWLLFRPSPRIFHGWRRWLLRCFGARIGAGSHIYPAARIWAPWNLTMGSTAAIADGAVIYNPAPVVLGDYAIVSQEAWLCAASHDYTRWAFPLISRPIEVKAHGWVAARSLVMMGVTVGTGCVIGAGSVVTRSMPDWTLCAGNPCRPIKPYAKS